MNAEDAQAAPGGPKSAETTAKITIEWDPSVDRYWSRCTCLDVQGRHDLAVVQERAAQHSATVHDGNAEVVYGLMPGSADDGW